MDYILFHMFLNDNRGQSVRRAKDQCDSKRKYLENCLPNDEGNGPTKWTYANIRYIILKYLI